MSEAALPEEHNQVTSENKGPNHAQQFHHTGMPTQRPLPSSEAATTSAPPLPQPVEAAAAPEQPASVPSEQPASAEQATPRASAPAADPEVPPAPTTIQDDGPVRPKVDVNAIYPQSAPPAAEGVYQTPESATADEPDPAPKNRLATLIIVVGGIVIMANAVIGLLLIVNATSDIPLKVPGMVLAICGFLLGLGIVLRRELARFIYVVLSALTIVWSAYGIIHYYQTTPVQSPQVKQLLAEGPGQIAQFKADKNISAGERAELIQQVETQQRVLSKPTKSTQPLKTALETGIIPIAAIVFLNWPSVKKLFR